MTKISMHFVSATDVPIALAPVTIRLSRSAINICSNDAIMSRQEEFVTDTEGNLLVDLLACDRMYHVTVYDTEQETNIHQDFYVPYTADENTIYDLTELIIRCDTNMSSVPYDEVALIKIMAAKFEAQKAAETSVEARDSAVSSAATAEAAKVTAVQKAAEAAQSAQIALGVSNLVDGLEAKIDTLPTDIEVVGTIPLDSVWIDIPKIVTSNPTLEVPNGPLNAQAKALGGNLLHLKNSLLSSDGANQVHFGTRKVGEILSDFVNPFTYMTAEQIANVKSGTGTVDVSGALQTALDTGLAVYLHDGEYLATVSLSGKGQPITGPGRIKTLKEPTIPTSVVASVTGIDDRTTTRMIYVEAAWDLQDLLTIKSLGYNTIVHYGGWANTKPGESVGNWEKMFANAKSVGLDVMMGTEWAGATAATATAIGDFTGSPVIAYVMYDEPIPRSIDKEIQEEKLASFRAATKKPLGVTENCQRGIVQDNLAATYDFCFLHIYPDAILNTMAVLKGLSIHGIGEATVKMPNAKIIATVGLFELAGGLPLLNMEFAGEFIKVSQDNSYGVFVWDGYGDAGILTSVRRNLEYRKYSKSMYHASKLSKPYTFEVFAWGADFRNLPLGGIKSKQSTPDSTPGVQPFSVRNVGSYVDSHQSNFERRAISYPGKGGLYATNISSKGYVHFRGYVGNVETPAVMDFSLLSTPSDWFEVTNWGNALNLVNYDLAGFTVSTPVRKDDLLGLSMTFSTDPIRDPWRFLGGLLVNTNWV